MNAHPETNIELRREHLEKWPYDQAWRWLCEVVPWMGRKRFFSTWLGIDLSDKYLDITASDVHHIEGSRSKRRWDLTSNLISVSRRTHQWLEENGDLAKIVCLKAKFELARTGNPEQLVIAELRQASGWNYPDYLETLSLPDPAATWRDEIVEHFSRG